MSASNGGSQPPMDGDEPAGDAPDGPVIDEGENVFEVTVEAGAVVTAPTAPIPTSSGGLAETDQNLAVNRAADMAFDATMDGMAFDATMDEMTFNAGNPDLSFSTTQPELSAAHTEEFSAPSPSSGFGAITGPAPESDTVVETLRRELESARSEVRIVVSQLNDLEKIRSYALQRGSEILMLKARQISLESEVDLYRELTDDYRVRCQGLEVQLEDVQGEGDGLGLGEADAEINTLQEELVRVSRARDGALAESERFKSDLQSLRGTDSREPLLARIDDLEASLATAAAGGDVGEEHAQLEARCHSLQTDLFKAQATATDSEQRADRLKVALERLRQAFVRTAEQSERVPELETEIEGLKSALTEAQSAPPESAGAQRITALEAELAIARGQVTSLQSDGAGQGAEFQAQIDALTAELEAVHALSSSLEAGDAATEVVALRRQTTDLEIEVSVLTRQLEEAADRVASGPASVDSAGDDKLERLRIAVQRSSAQIQRLLLELEGSRGSVQRARRDMQRYSRSVNALHEALNHLERYLVGAGPQAQQGVVLLQEVKRCAHEVRAMVESNDRFGRSMSSVVERLSRIVSEH
jgi:hypothetical protein